MAHPYLRRLSSRTALATIAGAAVLIPAAPVLGQSLPAAVEVQESCEDGALAAESADACQVIGDAAAALGALSETASQAATPVTEALPVAPPAQLTDTVDAIVQDEEQAPEAAPAEEAPTPPVAAAPAPSSSQGSASSTSATTEPSKVEAAGKTEAVEVTEPQAPAIDGRVSGAPTIQPANLGANIPSIRSESSLTLQPFEAPIVSIPMEAPLVAGPVSTATPVQAAAVEAMRFTGESLVPYTTGAGAWITATGLGLLAGAGFVLRRRADGLNDAMIEG